MSLPHHYYLPVIARKFQGQL